MALSPNVFFSLELSKRNSVNPRPDYISSKKKSRLLLLPFWQYVSSSHTRAIGLIFPHFIFLRFFVKYQGFFPSRRDLNFRDEETKLFLGKAEENIENGNAQFHLQVTRLDMDDKSAVRELLLPWYNNWGVSQFHFPAQDWKSRRKCCSKKGQMNRLPLLQKLAS